jgi:hypothetical protein
VTEGAYKREDGKWELGMVAHIYNPALGRLKQEDREFRPTWVTKKDTVSKKRWRARRQ